MATPGSGLFGWLPADYEAEDMLQFGPPATPVVKTDKMPMPADTIRVTACECKFWQRYTGMETIKCAKCGTTTAPSYSHTDLIEVLQDAGVKLANVGEVAASVRCFKMVDKLMVSAIRSGK